MKNDIFISYASKDKHIADAVCSTLENSGIRCWFAPRDIFPGSDWAQSIINAIKSSKIMILIFSQNSNASSQVTKELNLAVSNNLMIVPFKIDDSVPSGSMEYFLADMHWLDAIDGDMQEQINRLKDIIVSVLPHNIKDGEAGESSPQKEPTQAGNDPQLVTTFDESTEKGESKIESGSQGVESGQQKVGIFEAYKRLWLLCFDYKGCASRAEYWKAALMNVIVMIVVLLLNVFVMSSSPILITLYTFAVYVPFISLGVRRLHDTNHSGHWMWLLLTGYGAIALYVFFCFKTETNDNRFKTI